MKEPERTQARRERGCLVGAAAGADSRAEPEGAGASPSEAARGVSGATTTLRRARGRAGALKVWGGWVRMGVDSEPSAVGLDTAGLTGQPRGWFLQEADPCPCFLGAQPSAVSEDAVWDVNP